MTTAADEWTWFKTDAHLEENKHFDGLTLDQRMHVYGTLVVVWGYCRRNMTDGFVSESRWRSLGSLRGRRLAVDRGLVERVEGGYQCHNYQRRQRTKAEAERAAEHARKAAEARWGGDAPSIAPSNADGNEASNAPGIAPSNADPDRSIHRDPSKAGSGAEVEPGQPGEFHSEHARGRGRRYGRPEPGSRAGDRPASSREICRRCGGAGHAAADCPTVAPDGPRPARGGRSAPPPAVAVAGAAQARQWLAEARGERATVQAAEGEAAEIWDAEVIETEGPPDDF